METQTINTKNINEHSFLSQSISLADAKKNPEKLANQFEAYFYRILLKEMRNSSLDENTLFNSNEMNHLRQLQDEELAGLLGAQGKLGIKKMILNQLDQMTSDNTYSPDRFHLIKQGTIKPPLKTKQGS
jgi:Rod binding domain-containing protein